jgi:MFS family permease
VNALRDLRFRRLLVGLSLSSFGDSALFLTFGIWAKDLTGSNAIAGSVFLALAAPGLLAPLGGHLVDRVGRRRLMIVTNLATAAAVLPLLLVHDRHQLWIIYAVAVVYGASLTLHSSARGGLLRDMLPDEDLGSANALFQTTSQGVRLLSPLVGAALYTTVGGGVLALADAATFLIAVVALASIRVDESEPEAAEPFRQAVVAGFRHLKDTAVLAHIVVAAAVAFCVIGFYDTIVFAVVDDGLHRSPSFTGVLLSIQGGGSILGGLSAAYLMRRWREPGLVALSLAGFAFGSVLLTSSWLPVIALGVIGDGIGVSWLVVGVGTAVQRFTPPRLVGRTSAATNLLLDGPQTASIAIGAVLTSVVDYRVLLLVVAVVIGSCSAWLFRVEQREPTMTAPVAG